jgi:hypothetical protein
MCSPLFSPNDIGQSMPVRMREEPGYATARVIPLAFGLWIRDVRVSAYLPKLSQFNC